MDDDGGAPVPADPAWGPAVCAGDSDTRGNLACTLLAVRAIRDAGVALGGTLQCVYTVDEEKNGPDGSIFLLDERGLTADFEITCEPTGWTRPDGRWGMGIAVANCGNFLVRVETTGTKTHLWRPDTGVNAVNTMARLLTRLETMTFTHRPAGRAGGTPPMVTVVRIEGGVKREMQFTPDRCRAVLAVVGVLPGMDEAGVLADIRRVIAEAAVADPALQATAEPYPQALFVDGTREQDPAANPTLALRAAYRAGDGGGARAVSEERVQRHDSVFGAGDSGGDVRTGGGWVAADQRVHPDQQSGGGDEGLGVDGVGYFEG